MEKDPCRGAVSLLHVIIPPLFVFFAVLLSIHLVTFYVFFDLCINMDGNGVITHPHATSICICLCYTSCCLSICSYSRMRSSIAPSWFCCCWNIQRLSSKYCEWLVLQVCMWPLKVLWLMYLLVSYHSFICTILQLPDLTELQWAPKHTWMNMPYLLYTPFETLQMANTSIKSISLLWIKHKWDVLH